MNNRTKPYSPIWLILILCLSGLTGCDQGDKPSFSIEVASVGVYGGTFSDDGQFAIVGSVNHGASLWRIADGERLYNWNHHKDTYSLITAADFSPDGDWALTADAHTLVLWSMKDGNAKRFWTSPGEVQAIALSRAGAYALLGLADNTAVLFDVQRGGIRRIFKHDGVVHSVALDDAFTIAVTGSADQTARLWDLKSGKQLFQINHADEVELVVLSPKGNRIFSTSRYDKGIVWDAKTGLESGSIPLQAERLKRGLRVTSARFSDDEQRLLTGFPDRTVQLWNLDTLSEQGKWLLPKRDAWKPSTAGVLALAFGSQPNQYFALASNGFIHQLSYQLQTPP